MFSRVSALVWRKSSPVDPWPFTNTFTIAAAIIVYFWIGVAVGYFGAKGELL